MEEYFLLAGDALSLPARTEVPREFKGRGHLSVTNVLQRRVLRAAKPRLDIAWLRFDD